MNRRQYYQNEDQDGREQYEEQKSLEQLEALQMRAAARQQNAHQKSSEQRNRRIVEDLMNSKASKQRELYNIKQQYIRADDQDEDQDQYEPNQDLNSFEHHPLFSQSLVKLDNESTTTIIWFITGLISLIATIMCIMIVIFISVLVWYIGEEDMEQVHLHLDDSSMLRLVVWDSSVVLSIGFMLAVCIFHCWLLTCQREDEMIFYMDRDYQGLKLLKYMIFCQFLITVGVYIIIQWDFQRHEANEQSKNGLQFKMLSICFFSIVHGVAIWQHAKSRVRDITGDALNKTKPSKLK